MGREPPHRFPTCRRGRVTTRAHGSTPSDPTHPEAKGSVCYSCNLRPSKTLEEDGVSGDTSGGSGVGTLLLQFKSPRLWNESGCPECTVAGPGHPNNRLFWF